MNRRVVSFVRVAVGGAAAFLFNEAACSNADNEFDSNVAIGPDAGVADGAGTDRNVPSSDAASGGLRAFAVPADPGAGGILFAASGEVLALTGYAFPPASDGDPAFVDGWDVKFSHLLTTIDTITLSENPDTAPGDPSRVGNVVATVRGPWAVDLSRSDPTYLAGKGGAGEQAVPLAALKSDANGAPLKTDGTRYAFGFDTVPASATAYDVNLDAVATAEYLEMVANGCVVLYEGTATFKGDKSDPYCYPPSRQSWPDVVKFKFCFKSPTSYLNCQNPDNDPAAAFPNEEHQRGIALKTAASVIGQVTLHTDHPFWDSVLHDAPAHFDQFASRVVVAGDASDLGPASDASAHYDGGAMTVPTVTLEMLKGVDYTDFTDSNGTHLAWRYCMAPPTDVHPRFSGPMSFDPESVPHAINGDPATGLRDYYDFATYDQSTQGHLNSDGLCWVKRNYPSPP